MELSPSGQLLAVGDLSGTVTVFDIDVGLPVHSLVDQDSRIMSLKFSPDAKQLISCSADAYAVLWDNRGGTKIARLPHEKVVRHAVFDPLRKVAFTSSIDGRVSVWDIATGAKSKDLDSDDRQLNHLIVDEKGEYLAATGYRFSRPPARKASDFG
jgi:WD40 repeat protein